VLDGDATIVAPVPQLPSPTTPYTRSPTGPRSRSRVSIASPDPERRAATGGGSLQPASRSSSTCAAVDLVGLWPFPRDPRREIEPGQRLLERVPRGGRLGSDTPLAPPAAAGARPAHPRARRHVTGTSRARRTRGQCASRALTRRRWRADRAARMAAVRPVGDRVAHRLGHRQLPVVGPAHGRRDDPGPRVLDDGHGRHRGPRAEACVHLQVLRRAGARDGRDAHLFPAGVLLQRERRVDFQGPGRSRSRPRSGASCGCGAGRSSRRSASTARGGDRAASGGASAG
jgi:hypothetical protein